MTLRNADQDLEEVPQLRHGPPPQPPQVPTADKSWRFYKFQLVGIPLLALITLAALFGLFGEEVATAVEGDAGMEVTATYPDRFRFKMIDPLEVTVRNESNEPLTGVEVRISRDYLDSFSGVSFVPTPKAINDRWWVFELGTIEPGQVGVVSGEVQAEAFGSHEGVIEVASATGAADLVVSTFVFP